MFNLVDNMLVPGYTNFGIIIDMQSIRIKNSRQRTALLALLRSTHSHPTALWLYERLTAEFPRLSLGTVYRNLSILAARGLVRVLASGSGFDRFDGDIGAHYHVICEVCGKVEDLSLPADSSRDAAAAAASGFRITAQRLDFYGICPACRDRDTGL